jgi:hypothetical protein
VELRVVDQGHDERALVDGGPVGEIVGPADEQLVGVGEPFAGQECDPRIDDRGAPPDCMGEAARYTAISPAPTITNRVGAITSRYTPWGSVPDRAGKAGAQRVPGEVHELSVGRRVAERARPDPADVEEDAADVGPITTDRERGVARAGRPYDAESQPAMSPADGIRP